jgi:hypothetical protein
MKHRYPAEWLLISCVEMDDEMNVLKGEVIAHSPNRDQIYDAIATRRTTYSGTLAVEYVGEIPANWAVIL